MDRLFRIDFYPQDWLIDTARLAPDERGVFIQIVMMIYANRGPIPNDEKHLANLCGCSSRLVRSLVATLEQKGFVQISDGKIGQKRAENELNIKRNHLENSSKGGRTSAKTARKSSENEDDTNENSHLVSSGISQSLPTPTPTPTASPSPKAKAKDRESSPRKVGSRLPDDWQPGDDFVNFALQEGMTIEKVQREANFFRDFWISKPGQQGVKLDWLATWRNWIRREIDRGRTSSRPGTMPNGKPDYFGGLMGAAAKAAKATEGM